VALTLSPMMCSRMLPARSEEGRLARFLDHQFEALRERVLSAWKRILGSQSRFPLLITHGGVIRVILGQALDIPADALLRIEVPPACRTRLRVPTGEGRPSLMFHGRPDSCGVPY